MPKAKKKLLPKDFAAQLETGDLAALQAVFDTCELDARGGYSKQTALPFRGCPDDLTRWLVAQGADIEARDAYDRTPLHQRATHWNGDIAVLLDLGADIEATDREGDTPLHKAAGSAKPEAVRALLARGARADQKNRAGLTPLELGLQGCSNIAIPATADIAEQLLAATTPKQTGLGGLLKRALTGGRDGAPDMARMQASVRRIGENFEFHRAGFNPEFLDETSEGLDRLYALFGVPPLPRRHMHDGTSPIAASAGRWQDQQQELWALLVPSSGAAVTVQGEVIRIAGRIADEVDRNGAANWDEDFRKMGQAFLAHVASGQPLPPSEQERAKRALAEARDRESAGQDLCELSVSWVGLNPTPIPLPPPAYRR